MNNERLWVGLLWATVIMLPIALLLTVNLWVLFSSLAVAWLIGLAQTPGWKRWWGNRRRRSLRENLAAGATGTLRDRLTELDELRFSKQISEDEYQAKRKTILDGL